MRWCWVSADSFNSPQMQAYMVWGDTRIGAFGFYQLVRMVCAEEMASPGGTATITKTLPEWANPFGNTSDVMLQYKVADLLAQMAEVGLILHAVDGDLHSVTMEISGGDDLSAPGSSA